MRGRATDTSRASGYRDSITRPHTIPNRAIQKAVEGKRAAQMDPKQVISLPEDKEKDAEILKGSEKQAAY